jgi:hypothetical protein
MRILNKKDVIKELDKRILCAQEAENDAMLNASVFYSSIDPKFQKVKKKHKIVDDAVTGTIECLPKNMVIKVLNDMKEMLEECDEDMLFECFFKIEVLNPKFIALAQKFNLKQAKEAQEELEKSKARGEGKGNM